MKKVFCLISLFISIAVLGQAYLPKTSKKQIYVSPMYVGEVAWIDGQENDIAHLFIGNGTTSPKLITDPTSLHGYTINEIDKSEYSIASSTGIIYDNVDTYQVNSHDAVTLTIIVSPGIKISSMSARVYDNTENSYNTWTYSISDNVITMTLTMPQATTWIKITDIKVFELKFGNRTTVNDLTQITYTLKDSKGEYNFENLRKMNDYTEISLEDNANESSVVNKTAQSVNITQDNTSFEIKRNTDNNLMDIKIFINTTSQSTTMNFSNFNVSGISVYSDNANLKSALTQNKLTEFHIFEFKRNSFKISRTEMNVINLQ